MEKIEKPESKESKENYGKNVIMVIDLIRHAEKISLDGGLTKKGKREAKKYGKNLKQEFPGTAGIKVYHSEVERAAETGELIGDKGPFKKSEKKSLTLTGKISDEYIDELLKLINEQTGDESEAIQAFIDTGSKRPDEETHSSKEISQDIAEQLFTLIQMTKKFKENSMVNIALVSHGGVIEHFLVDILKKERKDFLKEVGGPLKFLEGARILVNRQDKDNVKIQFQFRDHQFEITSEDLENIGK